MTLADTRGIVGIHHVSLRVSDFERSLAFYRDTLGLALKTAFTHGGRRFALLETGNSGYIELVETSDRIHAARQDDVLWHFAARTADIDRSLAAVERAGCAITVPVTALELVDTVSGQPFSIRIAFFRGPDGEDVELFEDRHGHT